MRFTRDHSLRTLASTIPYRIATACLTSLVIATGIYGYGRWQFDLVERQSSTAIGAGLTTTITQSGYTYRGTYLDIGKKLMVSRLTPNQTARERAPEQVNDYGVIVLSDTLPSTVTQMDVLVARIGTDGDLFVGLPNPTDGVYTVAVANLAPTKTIRDLKDRTSQDRQRAELSFETSITQQLSSLNGLASRPQPVSDRSSEGTDFFVFRATIRPAINDPAYQTKTINTSLIGPNGINYDGLFNEVFKRPLVAGATQAFEANEQALQEATEVLDANERRLAKNPLDTVASNTRSEALSLIGNLTSEQERLLLELEQYQRLTKSDAQIESAIIKANVIRP